MRTGIPTKTKFNRSLPMQLRRMPGYRLQATKKKIDYQSIALALDNDRDSLHLSTSFAHRNLLKNLKVSELNQQNAIKNFHLPPTTVYSLKNSSLEDRFEETFSTSATLLEKIAQLFEHVRRASATALFGV